MDFDFSAMEKGKMVTGGTFTIGVILKVSKDGKSETIKPIMKNSGGSIEYIPASMAGDQENFTIVKLQPNRENPAQSHVEIAVSGPTMTAKKPLVETLVVEASIKPYINLVWMGTVTLVVGFIITIIRRVRESREGRVPSIVSGQ